MDVGYIGTYGTWVEFHLRSRTCQDGKSHDVVVQTKGSRSDADVTHIPSGLLILNFQALRDKRAGFI